VVTGQESESEEFVIRNRGVGVLTISATSITGSHPGDFQLTDNNTYPVNLAANQEMSVSVVFQPTGDGVRMATLQVTSTLGGVTNHAIPLSGTGFAAYVSAFPYEETFEAGSPMRLGWTQIQVSGTMNWSYGEGAGGGTLNSAHTGLLNARYVDMGSNAVTKLVSPVLNLSGVTNPELTFWYAQEVWSDDQNELKVYYRTASNQPWVEIYYDNTNVDIWKFYYLSLPNPTATYQIAFEGYDYYGYANVIDDVTIQQAPGPRTMWTGALSTDWDDPANWSNGVPGSGHAVVIGTGLNSPVIDSPVTVLQLTLSTAVDITLTGVGSLTVLGP
jgi:hypothetical protein